MSNIIVTTTVNKVTWDVDNTAYGKAMKQIRSLKKEWEKTGKMGSDSKLNPAKSFIKSSNQSKLVSKRLAQVERAEMTKTTAHAIAQTKKRLRAEEALSKQHAQRRGQVMKQMTSKDPELAQMRKYYQGLQKQKAVAPEWRSSNRPSSLGSSLSRYSPSGIDHLGRPGQGTNSATVGRQTAAMNTQRQAPTVDPKVQAAAAKAKAQAQRRRDAEDRAYDKLLTGKETTIGDNAIRMKAKYGANYAQKVGGKGGGLDALNNKYLDSSTMRASTYRAELAAMEKQFRATNSAGMTFADGMKTIRRSMIGLTAAYTAFSGASQIISTGQFFQGMQATMLMVSDSSTEAGQRMEFVQKQAYRLGLDLKAASAGYTQMSIAADGVLSKSDNDQLFKGFSEYATALQVDPVKYQRGITAIQQMLGKGQVQAEELKGQLSEAIPGSMKIFVAAAQKYFKNDKIGVPELQELMKNGKLLAKDILPLVAQGYAEAANKGGALNKALASNRVAMQRLSQTWMNFQNKIFESGFGQAMTDLFNNLAKLLDSNGPLASNLGQLATGFVEAFSEIFFTVSDVFKAIGLLIDAFLKKLGVQMDDMDTAFNWAGRALGALVFFSALTRVFGILTKIAGLGASLKFLKDIFGGPDVSEDGSGDGKKKGKKVRGKFGKGLMGLGLYATLASLALGDNDSQDQAIAGVQNKTGAAAFNNPGIAALQYGLGGLSSWWSGLGTGHEADRLNYLNSNGMMPGGAGGGAAGAGGIPMVPNIEGTIEIKIDAGELQNLIDTRIATQDLHNINLITSGGNF